MGKRAKRTFVFTDTGLRGLQPEKNAVDYTDAQQDGLILRVLPSGKKQFSMRYRVQGKQRRFPLGDFPDLALAKAREKTRAARVKVDEDRDPMAEKQAKKAIPTDTVQALSELYMKEHGSKKTDGGEEDQRQLDADVLPALGDRSVKTLTRADIRGLLTTITDRGAGVLANRVLALIRKMLNFGVSRDWLDANPAACVEKPTAETSRERVLDDDEVRAVWRLLTNPRPLDKRFQPAPGRKADKGPKDDPWCPVNAPVAAVFLLRLITCQRATELMKMKWTDLQLRDEKNAWWNMPSRDAKNKNPHRVPLTSLAIWLIKMQPRVFGNPYVFTGPNGAKDVKDKLKKATAQIANALGFEFQGRDLRRTGATLMADTGRGNVPAADISRVLNHVDGQNGEARITKVYNRFQYDKEKRAALLALERVLLDLLPAHVAKEVAA